MRPVPALERLPARFTVRSRLGSGGGGTVFQVHDAKRRDCIALKILRSDASGSSRAGSLLRFKREFRSLADLRHPNLLRLYELFADGELWFFTMELIDGGSIDTNIDACLSLEHAFGQLAAGLQALHAADHLHRDLKPSNVMVEGTGRVVLLDFGLISGTSRERREDVLGTPLYASPEQLAGASCAEASDWYAFGVILFEALTGRPPFVGRAIEVMARKQRQVAPRVEELAPETPEPLRRLVNGLLERDPAARPSAQEVMTVLRTPHQKAGREAPLVGRDRELSALEAAFDSARARGTTFVWIEGESGVGKTALLRGFADRVGPDAWVLSGRCFEQESVPHKALDGLFDSLARQLCTLPRQIRRERLSEEMSSAAFLFPVLAQIPELVPSRALAIEEPQRRRKIAVQALRRLLASLAKLRALVLLVDDLQWADADSASLLSELCSGSDAPTLLFVGAHRPLARETNAFFGALPEQAPPLVVSALDKEAALELARALNPDARPDTLEIVADESGGLPFALEELSQHLRHHGDEAVRAADAASERLSRLDPEERALLELISVAGCPLPVHVIASAAKTPFDPALSDGLRRERWIQISTLPDGYAIGPYHDQTAEVVRASLDDTRRRALHGELAELLGRWTDAEPESVAVHYERSGQPVEARTFTVRAARRAASALAWDRAVRLYRRALELYPTETAEAHALRVELGDALAGGGRGAEAAEAYEGARRGADPELALELERRVADQLLRSGHLDAGYRALNAVLASIGVSLPKNPYLSIASLIYHRVRLELRGRHFEEREERACARDAMRRVDVLRSTGVGLSFVDSVRAAEFLSRSLLAALELGEPGRIARSLAYEACFVSNRSPSRRSAALALLDQSRGIANRLDDDRLRALCLGSTCIVEFHASRWQRCAELAEETEAAFDTDPIGHRERASVRFFWTVSKALLGDFAALERHLPVLLRAAWEHGDTFSSVNLRSGFPNLRWLARDDLERARREAGEAIAAWSQSGFHVQHFCDFYARVNHELYAGEAEAALALVERRWGAYRRSLLGRLHFIRVTCLDLRARAHLAAAHASDRDRGARTRVVARCAAKLRGEGAEWSDALAAMLEAGLTRLEDRTSSAARYADAAVCFERAGLPVHELVARRAQASAGDDLLQVDTALSALGIENPARYARMLAPGS